MESGRERERGRDGRLVFWNPVNGLVMALSQSLRKRKSQKGRNEGNHWLALGFLLAVCTNQPRNHLASDGGVTPTGGIGGESDGGRGGAAVLRALRGGAHGHQEGPQLVRRRLPRHRRQRLRPHEGR